MHDDPVFAYLRGFADFEQRPSASAFASFSLEKFLRLLARLGSPERGRASIHIAGTKGKGSVAHFADAILRAHGVRTLRYTSPHLAHWRERIAFDGVDLGGDEAASLLEAARPAFDAAVAAGEAPTFFEAVTATAFLGAARRGVEVDVLETGVGGRLDATNVVDPSVSVVTSIDLDHTALLGNTHELIAAEKGGIIKPGRSVWTGLGPEDRGYEVLRGLAAARGAPFFASGRDVRLERAEAAWLDDATPGTRFTGEAGRLRAADGFVRGAGPFQATNALLALAASDIALRTLGRITDVALSVAALSDAVLPGRAELIPGRPPLVLDGAHTERSIGAVIRWVRDLFPGRRTVLLAGCTEERDPAALFQEAVLAADETFVTRIGHPRSTPPERLRAALLPFGRPLVACDDPRAALKLAREAAGPDGLVVVTGSFYLVAALRTPADAE